MKIVYLTSNELAISTINKTNPPSYNKQQMFHNAIFERHTVIEIPTKAFHSS